MFKVFLRIIYRFNYVIWSYVLFSLQELQIKLSKSMQWLSLLNKLLNKWIKFV